MTDDPQDTNRSAQAPGYMHCPQCGAICPEQKRFPGLYTCPGNDCDWLHLTDLGAEEFREELCRKYIKFSAKNN